MNHYFAYGSNMNPARVAERGLLVTDVRGARLPGYRLTFNKVSREHSRNGHANIEFEPRSFTEGVLYELAHPDEILKMDPFERAPWNYGREIIAVHAGETTIWAWTYFANPAVLVPGLSPSEDYLRHLLAGRDFLSDEYFDSLLAWLERNDLDGP